MPTHESHTYTPTPTPTPTPTHTHTQCCGQGHNAAVFWCCSGLHICIMGEYQGLVSQLLDRASGLASDMSCLSLNHPGHSRSAPGLLWPRSAMLSLRSGREEASLNVLPGTMSRIHISTPLFPAVTWRPTFWMEWQCGEMVAFVSNDLSYVSSSDTGCDFPWDVLRSNTTTKEYMDYLCYFIGVGSRFSLFRTLVIITCFCTTYFTKL